MAVELKQLCNIMVPVSVNEGVRLTRSRYKRTRWAICEFVNGNLPDGSSWNLSPIFPNLLWDRMDEKPGCELCGQDRATHSLSYRHGPYDPTALHDNLPISSKLCTICAQERLFLPRKYVGGTMSRLD
jgi:hypothetical protein